MTHSQRDVVLIPVPFTDLSSAKRRPVLILSNNNYNSSHQDVVVAAITSNIEENPYGSIIESKDLEEGKLPLTSQIRGDKVYTLSQKIIVKKFGRLKRAAFDKAVQKIRKLMEEA